MLYVYKSLHETFHSGMCLQYMVFLSKTRFYLLICIFFILGICNNGYTLQPTFIQGTVYSAYDNSIVQNATITTTTGVTAKASSGSFSLRVPPNVYDIIVASPGYNSNLLSGILAAPGQIATVNMWLIPSSTETGYLVGKVVNASTRNPVARAFIATNLGGIALSNNDGYFTMITPSGTAQVTVASEGLISQKLDEVVIEPRKPKRIFVYLRPAASQTFSVEGVLKNLCTGEKIDNGRIVAPTGTIALSSNGSYSLKLNSNAAALLASAEGYQYAYTTATLFPLPFPAIINFNLLPSKNGYGAIQGTITDAVTFEPLPAVRIEADTGAISFSKDDGKFILYTSACTSSVMTSKNGYVQSRSPVSVSFNSVSTLQLSLDPLGSITGVLYDSSDNRTIQGALIYVQDQPDISVISGFDGSYSLLGILPGKFTLSVTHSCYMPETFSGTLISREHIQKNFELTSYGTGKLQGHIRNIFNKAPVEKARISADSGAFTESDNTGFYALQLHACQNQITVAADGYLSSPVSAVNILDNETLNFDKELIPWPFKLK